MTQVKAPNAPKACHILIGRESNGEQSWSFASDFLGKRCQPAASRRPSIRVGAVRLGELAVYHTDHHLCLPRLFRDRDRRRRGERPGNLGLCHWRERVGGRGAEPATGRHRRRRRAAQAVDHGIYRALHRRHGAAVVRLAFRRFGTARRGVRGDRQSRLRVRNDLQQRHAAGHREQGPTGAAVRLGMGPGLRWRARGPGPGAGRVRSTSNPSLRARPGTGRASPHRRTAGGHLVRPVRLAALRLHARPAGAPTSRSEPPFARDCAHSATCSRT